MKSLIVLYAFIFTTLNVYATQLGNVKGKSLSRSIKLLVLQSSSFTVIPLWKSSKEILNHYKDPLHLLPIS